jgi:hypothetical protein
MAITLLEHKPPVQLIAQHAGDLPLQLRAGAEATHIARDLTASEAVPQAGVDPMLTRGKFLAQRVRLKLKTRSQVPIAKSREGIDVEARLFDKSVPNLRPKHEVLHF